VGLPKTWKKISHCLKVSFVMNTALWCPLFPFFPNEQLGVPGVWHLLTPFGWQETASVPLCYKVYERISGKKNFPKDCLMIFSLLYCIGGSLGPLGTGFENCVSWGLHQVWPLYLWRYSHSFSTSPPAPVVPKKKRI